jgi:hypothetical protein
MRRSSILCLIVSLLLTVTAEAGNIIPCRAKTWLENARGSEKRVCRQMDAGSAHVAVLAVAPWEDYVSQMQVDLSVSKEDALDLALPVTSTHEETVINALVVALKAALPTSLTSKSEVSKTENGTTTTSSETKKEEKPGDISKAPDAGEGFKPTATKEKAKISDKPPAFDPVMRRLNALALFQEAKLLSLRIVDTAVPNDYTPFMLSLQITLMPNARREPYDAYTTVTFLPARPQQMSEAYGTRTYDSSEIIRIVPLLVTDNMESTRRADLSQTIRDLSLAAAAMTGNASLTASVRKQFDRTVKTESSDFNSLMTVARLSDNSLRVRLGALRGNDHYSVAPRTHNITLLVMVPNELINARQELTYVARTQFVDAVHGKPLGTGTTGMFGWRYENVVDEWIRDYELPKDIGYYPELMSLAQAADYAGFRKHLQDEVFSDAGCDSRCKLLDSQEHEYWDKQSAGSKYEGPNKPESFCRCDVRGIKFSASFRDEAIERIWADVSNFNGTGQYAKGLFALPEASSATRRFFAKMPVTPTDDGEQTVVTARGARFIAPARIRARLRVVDKDGANYYVDARDVAEDGYGSVKITFPSVRKLVGAKERAIAKESALMLSYASSSYRWNKAAPFEQTSGMTSDEIKALNDGGEVAYPVVSIIFSERPK